MSDANIRINPEAKEILSHLLKRKLKWIATTAMIMMIKQYLRLSYSEVKLFLLSIRQLRPALIFVTHFPGIRFNMLPVSLSLSLLFKGFP
jgi:hypothetical protein